MSYTNTDLLKHHLDTPYPVADKIYDQPVVISGDDYITFFGGSITEVEITVKSIQENKPKKINVTLISLTTSVISGPIVPGSVIVASDSSMGTVYKENQDYIIDYHVGNIIIKSESSLPLGSQVTVWYLPYYLYTSGSDYRVKSASGQIQKISTGDIKTGETVFVDYTPVFANVTEDIINSAVTEANAIIEKTIDPYRQFGADPILQTTATYRALEIVCRTSAMRELSGGRNNDRAATVWMKLAETYARLSQEMLRAFKEQPDNPSQPTHS